MSFGSDIGFPETQAARTHEIMSFTFSIGHRRPAVPRRPVTMPDIDTCQRGAVLYMSL